MLSTISREKNNVKDFKHFTDSKHMAFHQSLKQLREGLGYKSAKSFYEFMLAKKELSFNYSYYTRMESGSAFPSHKVIQEIASFMDKSYAQNLILAFCTQLFPTQQHTFEQMELPLQQVKTTATVKSSSPTVVQQNILTLRQVATIGKSFEHYLIFLIITLSRKPILLKELSDYIKKDLSEQVRELKEVKVIDLEDDIIRSVSQEQRFPPADFDSSIPKIYANLDKWDREIEDILNFKKDKKKFFIKRTSKRHLELLLGLLENIDGVIRISDEMDEGTFNEVFTFEYKLSSGKLPG